MSDLRALPSELVPFFARVPLFADLDQEALAMLAHVSRIKRLPQGYLLFSQDEPADAAYIVRDGAISIRLCTPDGRELVINEMRAGDCFGELALLTGAPRSATAVAAQASQVVMIPRSEFLTELEAQPKLMRQLIETLARRLSTSAKREGALAFLDAPGRLARILLGLGVAGPPPHVAAISQEELGQRAGITRQTAARILGEWRRRRWVATGRGRITILDPAALETILGDL